jgi:hypothetical protein
MLDSNKLKEVLKELPPQWAETTASKHNVSPNMVRYARTQAELGERRLRQGTLDIVESLVLLAKETSEDRSNPINKINSLL